MNKIKFFPDKLDILTTEYSGFRNFFPIASIDLSDKGISTQIHVVYVFFDADSADEKYFKADESGGNFSFDITVGKYKPTFNSKALALDDDYQQFLEECETKYLEYKGSYAPVEFPEYPDWWQGDNTPLNTAGQKMKFICQIDLDDIVDDDCRLFVFYDQKDNVVKHIFQRT